ncbi:MAG: hypothetical protein BWY78_00270 [Alphaproteobacteria bacterium ADurb.Bin438]|nr:MAG: hypothetical protein BWY78_00270 [Alphaproteobacteria bacterium ADurb.Bin438]
MHIIKRVLFVLMFLSWSGLAYAEDGPGICESSLSCEKGDDGSFSSSEFDTMCKSVSEVMADDPEATKRAASALTEQCKDVSDATVKKNCEAGANNIGTNTFETCGSYYGKEDATSKDLYQQMVQRYCSNVCHIEEAGGADKDGFFKKIGKAVVKAVKAIVDFIANMVSCIVGDTDTVYLNEVNFTPGPREKMVEKVWYENAFKSLLFGITAISAKSSEALASYSKSLLAIFFAIWLAVRLMKVVGSLRSVDPYTYLTDIGKVFFRAIIAVALISAFKAGIFDYFFIPVSQAFSLASQLIVKSTEVPSGSTEFYCGDKKVASPPAKGLDGYFKDYDLIAKKNAMVPTLSGEMADKNVMAEVSDDLLKGLVMMNTRLMLIISDGISALRWSFVSGRILCIIPDPSVLLTGLLMIAFAGVLAIIIPLKYIDVILRIGLVFCLMPIFLVCWVFPSTRKYSTKAFDIFMHGMILILILGVVTVVNVKAIDMTFGNTIGCITDRDLVEAVDISKGGFNQLLLMILLMVGSVKFLVIAPQLASSFVSVSSSTNIGDGLSKMVTQVGGKAIGVATLFGGTIAGSVKEKVKDKVKDKVKEGGRYLKGKAGSAINKFKESRNKDSSDLSVKPENRKAMDDVNNALKSENEGKFKINNERIENNNEQPNKNFNEDKENKSRDRYEDLDETQNIETKNNQRVDEEVKQEKVKDETQKVDETSSKADEKIEDMDKSSPKASYKESEEVPKDDVELSSKVQDVKKDITDETKNNLKGNNSNPILDKVKDAEKEMLNKKFDDKKFNTPPKDEDKE